MNKHGSPSQLTTLRFPAASTHSVRTLAPAARACALVLTGLCLFAVPSVQAQHDAQLAKARAQMEAGKPKTACKTLRKLGTEGLSTELLFAQGQFCYQAERYSDAARAARALTEGQLSEGEHASARYLLALSLYGNGKVDETVLGEVATMLREVTEHGLADELGPRYTLAQVLADQGHSQDALAELRAALGQQPRNPVSDAARKLLCSLRDELRAAGQPDAMDRPEALAELTHEPSEGLQRPGYIGRFGEPKGGSSAPRNGAYALRVDREGCVTGVRMADASERQLAALEQDARYSVFHPALRGSETVAAYVEFLTETRTTTTFTPELTAEQARARARGANRQ